MADIFKVLAPKEWTTKQIKAYLKLDPYQNRVSKYVIPLTHPRTGRTLPLKEFSEEIIGDSRLAIETNDSFIFVSRVKGDTLGTLFFITKILSKEELRSKKEN